MLSAKSKHSRFRATVACLLLAAPLGAGAAELKGLLLFDDPAQPGKATAGGDLVIAGTAPAHATSHADAVGTSLSGVITTITGTANALTATPGISPGTQYSIVADLFSPVAARSSWRSLYQTAATPGTDDGEYFIRNNNDRLGVADIDYSTTAIPETLWTRLVVTVDLTQAGGAAAPKFKTYFNGTLVHSHTGTVNAGTTGRFALGSAVHFFADNNGENGSLNIGALAIYNGVLAPAEVTALGAAGRPIANQPPSIAEGSPRSQEAVMNGPGVDLVFNASDPNNVPADHPAVAVSWYDAVKWCNARSEMEGRRPVYFTDAIGTAVCRTGQSDLTSANVNWAGDGYRLPTESEWERASRGDIAQAQFPWGNDNGDLRANHWDYQLFNGRAPDEDYPYTEKVGFFDGTQPGGAPNMANGFGLHDMAGNAWEWTWDRMGNYSADTRYDPRGPDTGSQRIQRGGSWWNYVDQANNYQRLPFPPDGTDDYGMIGFRCVRAIHPNE